MVQKTTQTRLLGGLAAIVLAGGIGAALAVRFTLIAGSDRFTRPKQPVLFYRPGGAVDLGAHHVFAVAHNAGDSARTATAAVRHGAQVVEIDVVSASGRLSAAHDRPLPAFGALRLRAPGLEEIWQAAAPAGTIELDLKQTSPLFLERLVEFLRARRGADVIVSSSSLTALRTVRDRVPWAKRFMSIRSRLELDRLRLDPRAAGVIQGVNVRQDLLDAPTTRWLEGEHLVVNAWVVEDAARARQLVGFGVDGITTDNLALVDLLAGPAHWRGPR